MNKNFRPTRIQILQAMEDQEAGKSIEPDMLKYLEAIDKALSETSAEQKLTKEIEDGKKLATQINSNLIELSQLSAEALSVIGRSHQRAVRIARNIWFELEVKKRPVPEISAEQLNEFALIFSSDKK